MIVHSPLPEPTDPLAELVTRRPELGPISLATLLAGLSATRDADDKAALTRALEGCGVTDCPGCGTRCESCGDRMCATYGPEPALTCEGHDLCGDCDQTNRCVWCRDAGAAS